MPRRQFTHLSQVEIRDIVTSYYTNGEAQNVIASRLGIDHSTVHYHIRKYNNALPEESNVYSLVKISMKRTCTHPSLKCHLCGSLQDNLLTVEKRTIADLTAKLQVANERLEKHGLLYVE